MMNDLNIPFFRKTMFAGMATLFLSTGVTQANPVSAGEEVTEKHAAALPLQKKVTITGVVKDALGPVVGANVVEKGTTNGTVTDMEGRFSLQVSSNAVLIISYIGYIDQAIPVNGKSSFTVLLKEDSQALDEVVVVGYGTQKKVNMTGAVASVDMSKMVDSRPITSLSAGLAGMAPGVSVTAGNGGRPGNDGATIRVRGQGTLNDSNPLVIIDGVEASMNNINPQDVESISVLKDAASSAIYGSRAANGVILITTRRGKSGEAKITVTSRCRKWRTVSTWSPIMPIIWNCIMKGNLTAASPRSSAKRKSTNGGLPVTVILSNIRTLTGRTLYFRPDGCRTIQSISTEDLTRFTIIYPVIT